MPEQLRPTTPKRRVALVRLDFRGLLTKVCQAVPRPRPLSSIRRPGAGRRRCCGSRRDRGRCGGPPRAVAVVRYFTSTLMFPSRPASRIRRSIAGGSCEVEAIEVHHLVPGRDEVLDELLLRVRAAVDLRQGAELGVRAEDEIDARAGPLDLAGLAIAPLEQRRRRPRPASTRCPCRAGSRRSRWSAPPAAW